MAEPILVVEDLLKSYGDNHAVRGVSFRVARGEIFGLLGPAGATGPVGATGPIGPQGPIGETGADMASAGHAVRSTLGQFAIGPADALQAATALVHGATAFVTNDRLLERLSPVLDVVILDDL